MERYFFSIVPIALITLGVCLLIRPAEMALRNRVDTGDFRPATPGEILRTRSLGGVLVGGGINALYALLMKLPGVEFFPA